MLRILRWILVLALVAAVGWAVLGPEKPTEVRAVRVERGTIEHLVPSIAAGTLEARVDATVVAERGGTVRDVRLEGGADVEAGDVVVVLDDRDATEQLEMERLDLASVNARLAEARIRREQAARDAQRTRELWQEGVFTRQQAEQARTQQALAEAELRSLEATVKRSEAAIALAERRHADLTLRAPVGGRLKTVLVEPGDVLVPNQPSFAVMDASQLEVEVVIDEVDATRLELGQEARLAVEAYPKRTFTGRVAWIAPTVELRGRASRGIAIRVDLAEPDPDLRVGMTVDVDVLVGRSEDTLHVTSRAVTLAQDGPAVYRIDEATGEARLTPVATGIATFDRTELLEGVAAGDALVLETDRVVDGQRVTIVEGEGDRDTER